LVGYLPLLDYPGCTTTTAAPPLRPPSRYGNACFRHATADLLLNVIKKKLGLDACKFGLTLVADMLI
jgi:hypothetical protein